MPVRNHSKSGFTLIELLVVIAIIAILAAILFPVFAQAKAAAKKSVALSNTKQSGTGVLLYAGDNDDTFPLMHAIDSVTGTYLHTAGTSPSYRLHSVPAGWGPNAAFRDTDAVAWHNSVFPYTKNYGIFTASGLNTYTAGFTYPAGSEGLPTTGLSANGLLNGYPATAVARSSQLPLLTWANGKEAYRGYGYTAVYLRCNIVGTPGNPAPACVFNPGGAPQAGLPERTRQDTYEFTFVPSNDTTWVFGDGWIVVHADSSAKFYKQPKSGLNTSSRTMPGYEYSTIAQGATIEGGNVSLPARCVSGSSAPAYLSYFRPDSEFNYALGGTADRRACNP